MNILQDDSYGKEICNICRTVDQGSSSVSLAMSRLAIDELDPMPWRDILDYTMKHGPIEYRGFIVGPAECFVMIPEDMRPQILATYQGDSQITRSRARSFEVYSLDIAHRRRRMAYGVSDIAREKATKDGSMAVAHARAGEIISLAARLRALVVRENRDRQARLQAETDARSSMYRAHRVLLNKERSRLADLFVSLPKSEQSGRDRLIKSETKIRASIFDEFPKILCETEESRERVCDPPSSASLDLYGLATQTRVWPRTAIVTRNGWRHNPYWDV
jgi:hypothetical protein